MSGLILRLVSQASAPYVEKKSLALFAGRCPMILLKKEWSMVSLGFDKWLDPASWTFQNLLNYPWLTCSSVPASANHQDLPELQ